MTVTDYIRRSIASNISAEPISAESVEIVSDLHEEKTNKKPKTLENVTEIPEASAYVAHLATYPALAALNGLISSFPVPKIFASNGIPLLMYLRDNDKQ